MIMYNNDNGNVYITIYITILQCIMIIFHNNVYYICNVYSKESKRLISV